MVVLLMGGCVMSGALSFLNIRFIYDGFFTLVIMVKVLSEVKWSWDGMTPVMSPEVIIVAGVGERWYCGCCRRYSAVRLSGGVSYCSFCGGG